HQVAVAQHPRAGDAVYRLLVDRDADRPGEAAVAEKAGDAAVVADEAVGHAVEVGGGDAGPDRRGDGVEAGAQDAAGAVHQLDLLRLLEPEDGGTGGLD